MDERQRREETRAELKELTTRELTEIMAVAGELALERHAAELGQPTGEVLALGPGAGCARQEIVVYAVGASAQMLGAFLDSVTPTSRQGWAELHQDGLRNVRKAGQ